MVEREAREVLATAYERANLICPAVDVRAGNKIDWVRKSVALDAISAALHPAQPVGEPEGWREALEEIIANDDEEATIADLMQHDRNAGYLSGVRDCANIARAALASSPTNDEDRSRG
jgi:predicted secreted protein